MSIYLLSFSSAKKITFNHFLSLIVLLSVFFLTSCGGSGAGDTTTDSNTTSAAGEKDNPIAINYSSDFPYSNNISIEKFGKYFKITDLSPGQDYKLNLTSTKPVQLNTYDYSDNTSRSCQSSDYCIVGANSAGEAYIEVEWYSIVGTDLSYSYSLSMSSTNFEGSISSPLNLTALVPYSNTIPADLSGYYYITGLTPGNRYSFSLVLPTSSDSDLYIYQNAFISQACASNLSSNGYDEYCSFTAANDSVWIKIRANEGGFFDLTMTDNGLATSYSAKGAIGSEVELSLDATHYNQSVDYTASYYHIANLDQNTQYRSVLITEYYAVDNVDLYVYSDSTYSNLICSSTNVDKTKNEVCLTSPSATGELWIKVDGSAAHQYLGSNYEFGFYPYYPNEGTSSERIQLTFTGNNPLHSGTVDSRSYYTITGLVPGESYKVDASNYVRQLSEVSVGGANPVDYFTSDCEVPYEDFSNPEVTCIAEAKSDGTLNVVVEQTFANFDYTGTSFDLAVSLSPYQSEGTVDLPIGLSLPFGETQVSHNGQIGGAPSYYAITGLTADQAYTISIDAIVSHPLKIFTSLIDVPNTAACTDNYPDYGTTVVQCTVRALSDTLWVRVSDTNVGGAYTLTATHSPYQSEGSIVTAIQIAMPANQQQGVTRASTVSIDASYYQLSSLTIGETYAVAVRNIDSTVNHGLYVYENVTVFGSTSSSDYRCSSLNINTNSGDGYCLVTATDTSLWVMVKGDATSSGASYDLSARLQPLTESLGLDHSVNGTFPRSSSVGLTTSSYTVTGLSPNELYEITLSNMTDDVDISSCSTNTGLTNEYCVKQADGTGQLSVSVNRSKTLYGAYFTLGVTAGNVNEGTTSTPVTLDSTLVFPYTGQVGTGQSYYKVTGLLADTLYEVHLTNLTDNAGLLVYTAADFSTQQYCGSTYDSSDKFCGGMSTASGELYFSVKAGAGVLGANFNLNAIQGAISEGGIGSEIALAYNSADLQHVGTVDKSSSYYEITNLNPTTTYYVSVNSLSDNSNLYVYEDNTYSAALCTASIGNGDTAACIATTKNGGGAGSASLFVKVDGYWSVAGATYNIDVLLPAISEGSNTVPVALDYATVNATPYEGQVSNNDYSYYRLDNLTIGNNYVLSLLTQQDSVTMYVYANEQDLLAPFKEICPIVGVYPGTSSVCNLSEVTGASVWIVIKSNNRSGSGGTYFTLSATP